MAATAANGVVVDGQTTVRHKRWQEVRMKKKIVSKRRATAAKRRLPRSTCRVPGVDAIHESSTAARLAFTHALSYSMSQIELGHDCWETPS